MKKPILTQSSNPDVFNPVPFDPPFWLRNPHLQSILPKFVAPKAPDYRRVIERDSDDDSDVAYDYYDATASNMSSTERLSDDTPLVVLFHGMEGSSDSHYARALAHYVHAQGWHFVVAHFRSCGGIAADGEKFYNAGDTKEVHHMLQVISKQFTHIYAVGVSLGGNALAKYMGEYTDKARCKAAVAISAPVDMSSAAITMHRFISHKIYTPYLLNPIVKKALKNQISDSELDALRSVDYISDFDHIFTAPRHGYRSSNDYYHQASALPYLVNVTKPLLLISAKDDPFIGFTATDKDVSDVVTIIDTQYGGHVGFLRYRSNVDNAYKSRPKQKKLDINWLPETVCAYFKTVGINRR